MARPTSFLQELGYPVDRLVLGDEVILGVVWIANQAQRQVARVLKPFGLTPVKMNYLIIVKHIGKGEGLSQREIARRLLIDAGNVTHVLDDLEHKGWVIRAAGPDRRSHRIQVTAKGSGVVDEAWPVYKKEIQRLTGGLSSEGQRRLLGLLCRWRDAWEG
jgi:MarR family 2-MHQ and catechol resistance regulon transcriptional repressor